MKKQNYLALGLILASIPFVGSASTINSPLNEECLDGLNQESNLKVDVKRALIGDETMSISKTFVQYGQDPTDNKYVLRFATAVKGNISSIKYVREIEGKDVVEKEVSEVYRGILANDSTYYYDGSNLTTNPEMKGLYYWACYTIHFNTDTYRNSNISAYIKVIEEDSTEEVTSLTRTTTLQTLLEGGQDKTNDEIELENAKKEKINLLTKIDNRFRVEEQVTLNNKKEEVINSINTLKTKEEVEKFSTKEYEDIFNNTTTDAQYLFEELKDYDTRSEWPLVTEHRNTWIYSKGKITTNSVGYALSDIQYELEGMSFEFSVSGPTGGIADTGILLANPSTASVGGLNGYLLDINSNSEGEHFRVYYLENAYNQTNTDIKIIYLGGWVHETTTNGQVFRIEIKDGFLKCFDKGSSINGGETINLNSQAPMPEKTFIGALNWVGSTYDITLDNLITNNAVNGLNRAKSFLEKEVNKIDLNVYDESDCTIINTKVNDIKKLTTYNEVLNGITELKSLISSMTKKTVKMATEVMDNIFSTDKSEKSSWDLVVDHAMSWTHQKGTNLVTTPNTSCAGWQLTKDKYQNIDMVMNVKGCQDSNPYGSDVHKAFYIGASSNGNYPKGYALAFYQSSTLAWIQVHYMDGNGLKGVFIGGICEWVNDLDIRVTVVNKELKIFIDGQQRKLSDSTIDNQVNSLTLDNYEGGSIGILSWDDLNQQTTFTLKEFSGNKIN